jgi:outer membrane protein assembly factor BamD (BamD/ComL family)
VEEEAKPQPIPQSVFEQAAALERRDPARASHLYGTLESGSDSWAKNALYARAQLEASRGNHGTARKLLERYLQRFPRGENAEDARAVLERLR